MTEQAGEKTAPINVVVTTGSTSVPPHPCITGHHRWAWLADGRQACGYCGKARR